ncbi:MAG: hypothetical protein KKE17_04135, partial [Proteobacteria bacterium]|nr:hypothetical protein [Pseudomonadota bacterium]
MFRVPAYLQLNRYGIYSFRLVVPMHLRGIICKTEIKRSLHTGVKAEAIIMAREHYLHAYKILKKAEKIMANKKDRLDIITIGSLGLDKKGNLQAKDIKIDEENTSQEAYQKEVKLLKELIQDINRKGKTIQKASVGKGSRVLLSKVI